MGRGERTVGTVLSVGSFLVLVACGSSGPGTPGELGEGDYSFTYECLNRDMVGCVDAYEGPEVPKGIVVGGQFGLRFQGKSSPYEPSVTIEPAATTMVEKKGKEFVARLAGNVAMLGIATADGRVVDLVHLNLVDLHEFRLEGPGADGAILAVGEQWRWHARPVSESGDTLAGTLGCSWHSSDVSVVRAVQSATVCWNDIRGIAPGTATITMSAGDISKSVNVTVE